MIHRIYSFLYPSNPFRVVPTVYHENGMGYFQWMCMGDEEGKFMILPNNLYK